MDTISLWEAISIRISNYPKLTQDLEVDVAIIGGGITGITAASHHPERSEGFPCSGTISNITVDINLTTQDLMY